MPSSYALISNDTSSDSLNSSDLEMTSLHNGTATAQESDTPMNNYGVGIVSGFACG